MKRIFAATLALILCLCATGFAPAALAAESVSARTPLKGSSYAKRNNIDLAASHLNAITIPCGARFSFNDIVGPRTAAYGYQRAANGRGSRVTGGGVAQCATTLYLALEEMGADVEYTDFKTYGSKFSDNYVSDGEDAVMVDYASGSDFAFINHEDDMFIEMWTSDSYLYCCISFSSVHDEGGARGENFLSWSSINAAPARLPVATASVHIDGDDATSKNILLAASSINDTVLDSGDLFSFNDSVGPRSKNYGYVAALNGRGAKVTGGGVAQVASALWLAVKKLDCVAVVEKSTYGSHYSQNYVESSNDAILTDYANDTDFSFRNTGDAPLTLCVYLSGDTIRCDVYQN